MVLKLGTRSRGVPVGDGAWSRTWLVNGMTRVICVVCMGKIRDRMNADMTLFNERRVEG